MHCCQAPKDPKYAPLFKAKAVKDFKTGEMPKIFDITDLKTVLPLEYIVKGTTAKLLVCLPSIYLINKTYGISARVLQAFVVNRPAEADGCLMVPDDEDISTTDPSSSNTDAQQLDVAAADEEF